MTFTPENIVENLDKIGPWSMYYLAEIAFYHFFQDEMEPKDTVERLQFMADKGDWPGMVKKYAAEVGYTKFKKGCVNRF